MSGSQHSQCLTFIHNFFKEIATRCSNMVLTFRDGGEMTGKARKKKKIIKMYFCRKPTDQNDSLFICF